MTTMTAPNSAAPAGDESRDLQREALRALVDLSNESAVNEQQIEQRRANALAEAKKRHDKEVAKIDAEAEQQLDDLREQDEQSRSRIADDVETADVETKQAYQQASWL